MIEPRYISDEGCVFWVDAQSGALRHGPLIREQGDLLLVRLTHSLVVEIHRDQLKPVPPFFGGARPAAGMEGLKPPQGEGQI